MSPKGKARKPGKPAKVRTPRRAQATAKVRAPARPGQEEEERQQEEPLEPEVLEPEAVALDAGDEGPAAETTLPVPVERDLARADALQRYMAEVARHPLLSREEEHELAVKFHDCADAELGEKGAAVLFGELQALERLTSLRDLRTAADLAA